MLRWLIGLLLLVVALPALAAPAPGVLIVVTRDKGGDWLVDYEFAHRSPVWFFRRYATDLQGKAWRPQSWTVETPGVELVHAGHYDALTGKAPLRHVRIRMKPFAQPLIGDYTPALAFSDGGLALYTDQFTVAPLPDLKAVAALPSDLNGLDMEQVVQSMLVQDPGHRLLVMGKSRKGHAAIPLDDEGTYVYLGDAPVIDTPAFAGVLDSGLPGWTRDELNGFTPQLFRLYTERLGTPDGAKPMALVAWQGSDRKGYSLGGSVLTGMVVMQISGQSVLTSNARVLEEMRWFIGHESAHFWLGQTVRYARRSDSWIMEGGADMLAIRAFQQLSPGFDPHDKLQQELDDCLQRIGPDESLRGAEDRDQFHAHYSCGALLMLAAEAFEKKRGGDMFGFVRALIAARHKDGTVNAGDWLDCLAAAGADAESVEGASAFITKGVPDPRALWRKLFDASGVAWHMAGEQIVLG